MPVLASMELVAESSVEDGGKDLMGMRPALEETLEFNLPVTKEPLLVHAIRISFQRAAGDRDQNVRIALDRFTLVPRAGDAVPTRSFGVQVVCAPPRARFTEVPLPCGANASVLEATPACD